jgi:hypothetical protein
VSLLSSTKGYGNDGHLWEVYFDGTNWGQDGQVQNVGMVESPSAVVGPNGGLYVFHQGIGIQTPIKQIGSFTLWYSYFDGTTWHPDTPAGTQSENGVFMVGAPSAVWFQGGPSDSGLYVFHQGTMPGPGGTAPIVGDGQLWYSYFDGTTWHPDTPVMNVGMSESPSAVAVPGLGICVFHQGYGEDGWLWSTCTPDGTNWTPDAQVESVDPTNGFVTGGVGMSGSPSAVVYPPQ